MNQSTNYNFNLPEGTDLVNLLTQLIPNWSSLDSILKGVENQAFTNCTEVTSLGVHAISRTNADGKILKWIATSNFTAGETFTVDGNVVAAATPSGATLATGAYVTGAIVIAALNSDESAMTIFVSGTNVATDSERLGGELPAYYAKDSDMDIAEQAITDLDNLMGTTSISAIGDGTVTGAISAINSDLTDFKTYTTNEKAIGKWIDGKTIYRKSGYVSSGYTTGLMVLDAVLKNSYIDNVINMYGSIILTNGEILGVGGYGGGVGLARNNFGVTASGFCKLDDSITLGSKILWNIEYTKV